MDRITLTVPSGQRGAGVVSLVLGGLGSRLDLPVDRIDELALATGAAGASALGETLNLEVCVYEERLLVRLGPLASGSSEDAAKRRIIDPLVDGVAALRRDDHEWLELRLERGRTE